MPLLCPLRVLRRHRLLSRMLPRPHTRVARTLSQRSLSGARERYVPNISIIFDAPCLFIHHLLCVLLHFMAFYAFSGTNLLMRCHSASSLFSAVFVFQKSYAGNILRIRRNKSQTFYFSQSVTKSEDETEGGQRPGSP
jgi:hypothetical protein